MFPDFVKPKQPVTASWANNVVSTLRSMKGKTNKKSFSGGGSGSTTLCPFGKIISLSSGKHIQGGLITAGDKNYNVADYDLSSFTAGTKLVWIELPVTVNMDDDSELLLPNVETSSKTEITDTDWKNGTSYDDNTNPVLPTGIGTIMLPIGQVVTTVDGPTKTFKFTPTGCGNFHILHCAGTLSYSRT